MELPMLSQEEVSRYARTIALPGVGEEGQRKLKSSSVLIVGVGGLGSAVAFYLAAAGVGCIGIVDPQSVERSNLQRQIIHRTSSIGNLKVESARDTLKNLNPHVHVDVYTCSFTSENGKNIAKDYEILIDGTDNFSTRYLINNLCALTGKPYVYGAVYQFEGQVTTFDPRKGPCYRCLFPEQPHPDWAAMDFDTGIFSVLPGTIGTLQASEVLKLLLNVGTPLIGRLLLYNALTMDFTCVRFDKNPHCPVCGTIRSIDM